MKFLRRLLIAFGIFATVIVLSWLYTTAQLAHLRSDGVYPSAEEGMLALVDKHYMPDREVKILYAGTNSLDESKPYIWYVIAEVHASARADGSEMASNGCDAPGSFFLHTMEGWVHVPESAFPGFMGFWMEVFDLAGEGQVAPSTSWGANAPRQFCR